MLREEVKQRAIDILKNDVLKREITDISDVEPLGEGGLGVDSMSFLKYLTELEKEFGIEIEDNYWDYKYMKTIGEIVDYIDKCLQGGNSL
jgi:acyl carrier protein